MIILGRPRLIQGKTKGWARVEIECDIDADQKIIWFEVEKKYERYLCWERNDAFLVGILNFAMRNRHDIRSLAPISDELYFQLDNFFIDSVCGGTPSFHRVKIDAEIADAPLENAGAVGTGISCGIDSFYTIALSEKVGLRNYKVTHLTFNNVGSHGEGETAKRLYKSRIENAIKFCKENGYEIVVSNSNIMDVIPQNHYFTHTYTSCFATLMLQKLYSKYYYSSSVSFIDFSLRNTQERGCGCYDLLSLNCFSTSRLKFYSVGANVTRMEKTRLVAGYEPSYSYLNVCVNSRQQDHRNCCICEKCQRTMLSLDAIGKLEKYRAVFDVDDYYKNKKRYLSNCVKEKFACNHLDYVEICRLYRSNISVSIMLTGTIKYFYSLSRRTLSSFVRHLISKNAHICKPRR